MKIDYPFKIMTHNNLILVDLPKTPEKYIGKGLFFTASNGIMVGSLYFQACYHEDDIGIKIYIRGIDDNNKSGTLVIDRIKIGYTLTEMQAEEIKAKLQVALDEFVEWMNKQEKPVTRLDVFKELFPKADLRDYGFPKLCPKYSPLDPVTNEHILCASISCTLCMKDFWSQPAPEKFQKKEDKG